MAEQLPAPTTEAPVTSEAQKRRRRRLMIAGIVVFVIVCLAVVIGGVLAAYAHPAGAQLARDLAIILLAALSIVVSIMLILLLYQVTMLTLLMRDEIKPLLESISETMNTVRGTAIFMSDNVVRPTIKVASTFAGIMRVFDSLAGIRSGVQPKQRKE